jgi:hypothetical protein
MAQGFHRLAKSFHGKRVFVSRQQSMKVNLRQNDISRNKIQFSRFLRLHREEPVQHHRNIKTTSPSRPLNINYLKIRFTSSHSHPFSRHGAE